MCEMLKTMSLLKIYYRLHAVCLPWKLLKIPHAMETLLMIFGIVNPSNCHLITSDLDKSQPTISPLHYFIDLGFIS